MAKQRKFRDTLFTEEELASLQEINNALSEHIERLGERQQGLLDILEKDGSKQFTWMLANILTEGERDKSFTPDPRFYPELNKRLEQVRKSGKPTDDGLHVSRIKNARETYDIRITLPLGVNIKEYLPAIQAFQDYFRFLGERFTFPQYVVSRYSDANEKVSCSKLVDEINQGIKDWSLGNPTHLNEFGLDDYLRSKKCTPESLRQDEDLLYNVSLNEGKLRRLVKYHRTGK